MKRSAAILLFLAGSVCAQTQDNSARPRGELLYNTFCVSCHTTQMHWRDKKLARDLPGLRAQVLRWQGNAGQNWDAADIDEVVSYLNRNYYRFPGGTDKG